jgi:hypothetical protein
MWFALMALLVGATVAGGVGSASAHDEECLAQLREVPLESLELSPADSWESLEWWDHGGWWFAIVRTEARRSSFRLAALQLWCSPDASANLIRAQELRDALGGTTTLEVVLIGDESVAYREDENGGVTIGWRHGNIAGSVSDLTVEQDLGKLEQLALDVDAMLP